MKEVGGILKRKTKDERRGGNHWSEHRGSRLEIVQEEHGLEGKNNRRDHGCQIEKVRIGGREPIHRIKGRAQSITKDMKKACKTLIS